MNEDAIKALGRAVIETEARAVSGLLERVDDRFVAACRRMLECAGRVVECAVSESMVLTEFLVVAG